MATNQTTNYQLNQWEPTDPVLRTDFNADNAKIETALASLEARVSVLSRVVPDLAYYMGQVGILSILKHDEHLSQWSMVCDAFQKSSRYEVTGQAVIQNGVLTVDGTGTVTSMNFGLGRSNWTKAQLWVLSSGTGTINVTLNGKEYTAVNLGASQGMQFWQVLDAYEDVKDLPKTVHSFRCANYPCSVENGEVFIIDTTLQDGTVERRYYRADDLEQARTPVTVGFTVEE